MKRVNCLLRVSSRQQLRGDDIPVQRSECRNYIDSHEDWYFQKEYVEKAVSGFKTALKDRDILQEILADAKSESFDVLLVYMSDRIGRKEDESPFFVTTLNKLGIEVWSVKEGQIKTQEHIDKLLNYIRFWQAEGESRKTGARVKDAQETFVRAGKFVGGYAPFGYRLEYSGAISNHGRALKKLVVNEEQIPIIEKIYDYAVRFQYGDLKIAKALNEEKIPAPKDIWKAGTIARILQNPVYMGYLAYNRRKRNEKNGRLERIPMEQWILSNLPNPELVIVPETIWWQAQKLREARRPNRQAGTERGTNRQTETAIPRITATGQLTLLGLVYCGSCGGRLTNGSKYNYWTTRAGEKRKSYVGRYRCLNQAIGSLQCSGKTGYAAKELETVVTEVVIRCLCHFPAVDVTEKVQEARREKLQQQRKEQERRRREKQRLQKEKQELERDREVLQKEIPAALRGESSFSPEQLALLLAQKEEQIRNIEQVIEAVGEEKIEKVEEQIAERASGEAERQGKEEGAKLSFGEFEGKVKEQETGWFLGESEWSSGESMGQRKEQVVASDSEKVIGTVEEQPAISIKRKEEISGKLSSENRELSSAVITDWGTLFSDCTRPEQKVILSRLIERIEVQEQEMIITLRVCPEELEKSMETH